jgi:2-C-methyl-D-erythritol 4-phosphate cytidylyltransferase
VPRPIWTSCSRSASAPRQRPEEESETGRGEGAPSATAVIPAAGVGERLGGEAPKALVELGGRPMLAWSMRAFAAVPRVRAAIVAAPPDRVEAFEEAVAVAGAEATAAALQVHVVGGGASRSESVAAAMRLVETDLVAVHDAARPLVTPELIEALVEKLLERPDAAGVIAATPLADTVKRAREPRPARGEIARGGPTVARTESRDHLWGVQTPQVFRTPALREALAAGAQRVAEAPDDAWLVEKQGGKVLIHPALAENLKVTTPFDLRVAELLLAERG